MKPSIIAVLLISLLSTISLAQPQWTGTGGPLGGEIHQLISHNGDVYAATPGGVFRSADFGVNWISAGLQNHAVLSLVVGNNNQLFAGTEDEGVFRYHATLGWQWVSAGMTITNNVTSLVYHPASGMLYALCHASSSNNRVYRSNDSGTTWTAINNGLTQYYLKQLVVSDNGYLYCSRDYIAGFYRSIDQGEHWTEPSTGSVYRDIITTHHDTLYGGYGPIYRSVDYGVTWTRHTGAGGELYSLYVSQEGILYAGTSNGLYRGTVDQMQLIGQTGHYVNTVLSDPANNLLYEGTKSHGVYRFDGTGWSEANTNLTGVSINSIAFTNGSIFCTSPSAVYRNVNGGEWTRNTGANKLAGIAATPTGTILTGGYSINRSIDNGQSWSSIMLGDTSLTAVAVSPTGVLYTGGTSIYRSVNDGATWSYFSLISSTNVRTFSFIPATIIGQWVVLVGTDTGFVSFNDNGYRANFGGLASTTIHDISDAYDSTCFIASNAGLYSIRTNNPQVHVVDSGLRLNSVCVTPTGWLFVATDRLVLRSSDLGVTWDTLGSGIGGERITKLRMHPTDGALYLCKQGGQVMRCADPTSSVREALSFVPVTTELYQNYPNPFNSSTTISYSLPTSSDVELSIFDVNGRLVEQLQRGMQPAGTHSVNWHAKNNASGTFLCRMMVNGQEQTRPLMLIK